MSPARSSSNSCRTESERSGSARRPSARRSRRSPISCRSSWTEKCCVGPNGSGRASSRSKTWRRSGSSSWRTDRASRTTPSTASPISGRISGRSHQTLAHRRLFRLRKLPHERRRVGTAGEFEGQGEVPPFEPGDEVANRGEDLPPRPFGGNPRDLGNDEVFRTDPLRRHDRLLNLSRLAARPFRLRAIEDPADPRLPLPASLRRPFQVVAGDLDRTTPIGEAAEIRRKDEIPGDRFMDREAPADPLAQDAIEQERLIAVDEHHEEVEGEGSEGADEILRTSRQTVQDRLLEPVGPRVTPQRLLDVSGVAECGPDLV